MRCFSSVFVDELLVVAMVLGFGLAGSVAGGETNSTFSRASYGSVPGQHRRPVSDKRFSVREHDGLNDG